MLIHLPSLGVIFMGDALMPFYGEPWVEEGFIDEALETMEQVLRRQTMHILHGHYGITVLYETSEQLQAFRNAYEWLVTETRKHLKNGYSTKDIVRLNLIPPGLHTWWSNTLIYHRRLPCSSRMLIGIILADSPI